MTDPTDYAVQSYTPGDDGAWDGLVTRSHNGTFLHSRRFLGYHGARFEDRSRLIVDRRGDMVAVFPAATDPADPSAVVSHPGITYGGLVHAGAVSGASTLDVLGALARSYAAEGATRLVYKVVPSIYHRVPASDDLYALSRLHAVRSRCDLSSTVDLERRGPVSGGRRKGLTLATRRGVRVRTDWGDLVDFRAMLVQNLVRHGTEPTHSLDELVDLKTRFPDELALTCGVVGEEVVAGALSFSTGTVLHAQYLASSDAGRQSSALDAVLDHLISGAGGQGCRYFDFGISTESQGTVLNESLYSFKRSFGAGGVVYEHYELVLEPSPA